MSDFIISQIRTYVPILVGAVASWLLTLGVELDEQTRTSLIIGLTGLTQAVYYTVVRLLEKKWPFFGVLLGSKKQPEYK